MEILTIVPVDEILSKRLPYVWSITDEKPYQNICNTFWNYFVNTWIMILKFAFTTDTEHLINRKNNPVETYNRHLNEILSAHISVPILVKALN